MKSNPYLYKVPLKFGVFGALLLSVLLAILFYIGKHPLMIPVIVDFRLLAIPIFVVFTTLEFRDYRNNRQLFFWQGMLIGFLCYSTMGIGTGLFILILSIFNADFVSQYIQISTEQLVQNKEQFIESIGVEAYNHNLAKLPSTSGFDLSIDYFIKTILLGLLFTIIISVFLKRQPHKT